MTSIILIIPMQLTDNRHSHYVQSSNRIIDISATAQSITYSLFLCPLLQSAHLHVPHSNCFLERIQRSSLYHYSWKLKLHFANVFSLSCCHAVQTFVALFLPSFLKLKQRPIKHNRSPYSTGCIMNTYPLMALFAEYIP